jgi:hypothetical protein
LRLTRFRLRRARFGRWKLDAGRRHRWGGWHFFPRQVVSRETFSESDENVEGVTTDNGRCSRMNSDAARRFNVDIRRWGWSLAALLTTTGSSNE